MAHWQDVGGVLGGPTRDFYSEGLQMLIVKIFKRRRQARELTKLIKSDVRFPDLAMGDFRAQVAPIKTGERRFLDLLRAPARQGGRGRPPRLRLPCSRPP